MSFPRYERYKDSGVEWLGEVPEHWTVCALKRIANLQSGDSIAPEAIDPVGEYPVYGGNGLRGFTSTFTHAGSYALIGRQGALCGNINYASGEFWASEHAIVVTPTHSADTTWLGELLREMNLNQYSIASAQPGLSVDNIRKLLIAVPTFPEQRAIGNFLRQETAKIDALVDEQQRLIELLKEKRQAVVSHTITRGLHSKASLKFSGADWLGFIPTHWPVERAGHLFIERDERSESGDEEMLTVSHLTGVTPRSEKTVNMFEAETTEGYKRVYPGDLVINTLWAWMGAMGVSSHNGIVSPAYHVYRPRPAMLPEYVNALVRISAFAKEASRWSKGVWSSRLRLYPQEMFQILFPVPPLEEQRKISERIRKQDEKMAELIQESELAITLLQERRTALTSVAVTGKIDIRASVAVPVMSATQYSSGFAHQLLAAEILDRCNSQRMGRIKLQKLIHLCEYHGQVSEVQGDYSRKAAGPFDARAMAGISKNLKKQKWFEEVKEGERYVYRPLEKRGEHKKYLAHWQAEMPRIDEVLSLLGNFKTRECEIVSTLYAAWNDLLIDGGTNDDAAILHEASSAERWHKSKEQIAPERWKKALQWMKDKGLVPVGYGKHTRHTAGQIGTTTEEAHEPA